MTIAWQTIALWGAGALALSLMVASLVIASRLPARFSSLQDRLDTADERIGAMAASLCDELGALHASNEAQRRSLERLGRQIEHLAADVARRETWKGEAPTRHSGVVEAVREGREAEDLVREHGLSPDEAELLVMLHGGGAAARAEAVR